MESKTNLGTNKPQQSNRHENGHKNNSSRYMSPKNPRPNVHSIEKRLEVLKQEIPIDMARLKRLQRKRSDLLEGSAGSLDRSLGEVSRKIEELKSALKAKKREQKDKRAERYNLLKSQEARIVSRREAIKQLPHPHDERLGRASRHLEAVREKLAKKCHRPEKPSKPQKRSEPNRYRFKDPRKTELNREARQIRSERKTLIEDPSPENDRKLAVLERRLEEIRKEREQLSDRTVIEDRIVAELSEFGPHTEHELYRLCASWAILTEFGIIKRRDVASVLSYSTRFVRVDGYWHLTPPAEEREDSEKTNAA